MKELNLIHLEQGLKVQNEGGDSLMTNLLAVYMASAATLFKAKTNPAIMDPLIEEAGSLPYEEAAEKLGFFTEALVNFSQKVNHSVLRATEKAKKASRK